MQKTKVNLIYWGLILFVSISLIPWVLSSALASLAIQILVIYGSIIVAFLGGSIWGWDEHLSNSVNLLYAIGFSLLGLGVAVISFVNLSISLVLLIVSLQAFLAVEKRRSQYFQANIKYAKARELITTLVTICCSTSLVFIHNPYI